MDRASLEALGRRYVRAWCSQDPESVAAFFAEGGSLRVNDDPPATGRRAIAEVARGFMTAFPDMIVTMDSIADEPRGTRFRWTLQGTNTGRGGTGHLVRISGYELWRLDASGLIAQSQGCFDAAEYGLQLEHGFDDEKRKGER